MLSRVLNRFRPNNTFKCWKRCLSSMHKSEATAQLNAFRIESLNKIAKMPVYDLPQLQDSVIEFTRQGDFAIASELLSLSFKQSNFDTKLASFFILELLEEPNYDRLLLAISKLEEMHRMGKFDVTSWNAAMECAIIFAAEKEIEKLVLIIPNEVSIDQNLIETIILNVYTPDRNMRQVLKYALKAQESNITLSKEMWSSVFDAILLPPDVESLTYTEAAMRDTDRQFHLLQELINILLTGGVQLTVPICEALNHVSESYFLPDGFLKYLEDIVKQHKG